MEQAESRPDQWFREDYFRLVDKARERIADYVAAPAESLVLVENASSAVNSVLRSLCWGEKDALLYLSTAYNMVKYTAGNIQTG